MEERTEIVVRSVRVVVRAAIAGAALALAGGASFAAPSSQPIAALWRLRRPRRPQRRRSSSSGLPRPPIAA
jgi:hypothetical protein